MSKQRSNQTEPITRNDDAPISLDEAGRRMGVSGKTVGRWVKDGLIEACRLPSGMVRVLPSTVQRFIGGTALKKGGGEG